VFTLAPTIRISWLAGALQALTLQLPLAVHKYLEPASLTADDFFKRWKQIGGPGPREAQRIFSGKDVAPVPTRRILEGFKWGVLDDVDPNVKNFVAASVLHTSQAGKIGCLVRLEPNTNNGVSFFLPISFERCNTKKKNADADF
jgi:AP-2 complex subunit alpha